MQEVELQVIPEILAELLAGSCLTCLMKHCGQQVAHQGTTVLIKLTVQFIPLVPSLQQLSWVPPLAQEAALSQGGIAAKAWRPV